MPNTALKAVRRCASDKLYLKDKTEVRTISLSARLRCLGVCGRLCGRARRLRCGVRAAFVDKLVADEFCDDVDVVCRAMVERRCKCTKPCQS